MSNLFQLSPQQPLQKILKSIEKVQEKCLELNK